MGEKNSGDEAVSYKSGRKKARGDKKVSKAHRFYRSRVWAFTLLGIFLPMVGFGFFGLGYTKKFEKYSDTNMIPILLIINYISMVACVIFWLIFAIVAFVIIATGMLVI